MKAHRQSKIRQIIENQIIETQEDLAAAIRARDIEVTQATVSRDIKDMQLVKRLSVYLMATKFLK